MLSTPAQELNKDSPFELLAQYGIDTYCSIPYPGASDRRPNDVNRFYHGGPHVSSTALNLELCLELYQHYQPGLLRNPDNSPLNAEEIKLLKLAAIYHDSANTSENCKLTREHADNFRRDMLKFGFDAERVEAIALAMENKDGNIDKGKSSKQQIINNVAKKNIYQKLIQSADCLDNLRTRGKAFEKKYLDIIYDLGDCDGFKQELKEIIEVHFQRMKYFQKQGGKTTQEHLKCAQAPNCYLAVKEFYFALAGSKALHSTEQHHNLSLRQIYRKEINAPKFLHSTVKLIEPNQKVYVRVLLNSTIEEEMKICNENLKALKTANIKTTQELKTYLTEQEKNRGKVYAPPGLKWRPATLIPDAELPIGLYANEKDVNGVMVIIDASDPDTFGCCYYKKNIFSNLAKNGNMNYTRSTSTRAKDLESPEALASKLIEINARRQGFIDDPCLQYFGSPQLECNETLLVSYKKIIGICILRNEKRYIDAAISACTSLADPTIGCYVYIKGKGFRLLTDDEIQRRELNTLDAPLIDQDSVELGKKLNIDNVSHISISSDPIKLKFKIDDLECVGYVKEGIPVVESKGIVVKDNSRFLKAVYKKYVADQLYLLNQTIRERAVQSNRFGFTLDFSLYSKKPNDKLYVSINIFKDRQNSVDEVIRFLHLILGKYANKLAVKNQSEDMVTVHIPMVEIGSFSKQVLDALTTNSKPRPAPCLRDPYYDNMEDEKNLKEEDTVQKTQKSKTPIRFFPQPIESVSTTSSTQSSDVSSKDVYTQPVSVSNKPVNTPANKRVKMPSLQMPNTCDPSKRSAQIHAADPGMGGHETYNQFSYDVSQYMLRANNRFSNASPITMAEMNFTKSELRKILKEEEEKENILETKVVPPTLREGRTSRRLELKALANRDYMEIEFESEPVHASSSGFFGGHSESLVVEALDSEDEIKATPPPPIYKKSKYSSGQGGS